MLLSPARFQPRFWAGEWGASAGLDVENKGDAGFGPEFGRTLPPVAGGDSGNRLRRIAVRNKKPSACAGAHAQAAGFRLAADLDAASTTRGAGVTAGDNLHPEGIVVLE